MLTFSAHPDRPTMQLLVRHDGPDREIDYSAGAEQAPELATTERWTAIRIKDDWTAVFSL
ncbi:hypothetical protein ACVH9Z_40575 [Rhodococcus opacus]|uniref:hypothetical protein n=1 Tax=Rhodococcus opacus TaxID=37919 RepID=UPI0002A3A865|nr:hypothetical protein [Rhodococcus opacus]ELB90035.1 acid phosphatase [Rhodococcus wratislaviensis IFP 2016]MDV6248104.1 hypothetical protein [Rhodococcus opacus]RYJ05572.1 MAG: hypothetical protein EON52_10875 [Actinomycetales bacterium]WKN59855.1 hypothetical protein HJ581_0039030 [Rhodococcus opacus]